MIEKSVMKTHEYKTSIMYRIACDCGGKDCDLTLELEKDEDVQMLFLNLYKDLAWSSYWKTDNWFENIWLRIKCALRILFTGYIKVEEGFVMRDEQINGFIKALQEAKEKFKETR